MYAMVLHASGQPLEFVTVPDPQPAPGQLLVKVDACGVCRTDLHILDGDLKRPKLPLIPGHEIVGRIVTVGSGVTGFSAGQRVGIPWLGRTCGRCRYCGAGRENLCDGAQFTGYDIDGGYAEYCVADSRYCFPIDESTSAACLAPLLCAGLIGYRSLRMAGDAERLGIYGFGAAAHLIAQVALFEKRKIYAFTRPGDFMAQRFARDIRCCWTGGSDEAPPEQLDAAIIFAPVGALIPTALKAVRKGGTVVCGGIHMSTIPAFDYDLLWGERSIRSVANLTHQDATEFLQIASTIRVVAQTTAFPLREANVALEKLRKGEISGAAVLVP